MASQPPLFSPTAQSPAAAARGRLDDESERLLGTFQSMRLAEGAHVRSAVREVSQLRAVAREAVSPERPVPLRVLVSNVEAIARVLREPKVMIARSTGRARLLAVQRFVELIGPELGRDPAADLANLDALLPAKRSVGWHAAGTVVAGTTGRRRRRGPSLDAADLHRIVDAAAVGAHPGFAGRDRALVALHCFSGLRAEEIVRLRWEDLATDLSTNGYFGPTAAVERDGRQVQLPLPAPATDAVEALAAATRRTGLPLSGSVFRAFRSLNRPLGYRAARNIVKDACRRAGLPIVESVVLRSACAHWLRSQGLSDHEVAAVLGLARVKSLDRLLRHHAALDAQRTVREIVALL